MVAENTKRSAFETRIHEIDLWRGILMLLVIIDHLFNLFMSYNRGWAQVDLGNNIEPFYTIFRIAQFYWDHPVRMVVRWICLGSFCFVSGISCAFSRNNWKRAGQMIVFWIIILGGSNILDTIMKTYEHDWGVRSLRVDFNVIGVLAWSMLIYCFIQDKHWKWLIIVGGVALLLHPVCVLLSWTEWGKHAYVPMFWEPAREIADQADYMPLLPYFSFFIGGALLSKFTYGVEKKSYFKRYNWERPICFVGRHSLLIYCAHFFILIGIFSLLGLFIK